MVLDLQKKQNDIGPRANHKQVPHESTAGPQSPHAEIRRATAKNTKHTYNIQQLITTHGEQLIMGIGWDLCQ